LRQRRSPPQRERLVERGHRLPVTTVARGHPAPPEQHLEVGGVQPLGLDRELVAGRPGGEDAGTEQATQPGHVRVQGLQADPRRRIARTADRNAWSGALPPAVMATGSPPSSATSGIDGMLSCVVADSPAAFALTDLTTDEIEEKSKLRKSLRRFDLVFFLIC